jgi:hypothetical protein
MGIRGRKSAAQLSVVVPLRRGRKEPPKNLTEAQAAVWREVMGSTIGQYIGPEAYPMLIEYCRWVECSDQIAEALKQYKPEWLRSPKGIARWNGLIMMAERASRSVNTFAVKLRIPPSTREHRAKVGRDSTRIKSEPWDAEDQQE